MTPRTPVSTLQGLLAGTRTASGGGEVDRDVLVAAIDASLQARRLTLFVGAGLSYEAGLPTWSALLARLAASTVPPEQRAAFDLLARYDSPLVVARYLKAQLGVRDAFHATVHAALYDNAVDYDRPNPTLDLVIGVVSRAVALRTTLDIVTYNFDDLIESALAQRYPGVRVVSVTEAGDYHCAQSDVRVLHVHGLLPRAGAGAVLPPPTLVLSEDEFHRRMNDPDAWQNRAQADAFAWRDCLFLGLSLTDPNLRRIIDYATPPDSVCAGNRWIVARRYRKGDAMALGDTPMDGATAAALNAIKRGLYADLSAQVHYLDGFDECSAIAAALDAICV